MTKCSMTSMLCTYFMQLTGLAPTCGGRTDIEVQQTMLAVDKRHGHVECVPLCSQGCLLTTLANWQLLIAIQRSVHLRMSTHGASQLPVLILGSALSSTQDIIWNWKHSCTGVNTCMSM